jgi:hypothetical protein
MQTARNANGILVEKRLGMWSLERQRRGLGDINIEEVRSGWEEVAQAAVILTVFKLMLRCIFH